MPWFIIRYTSAGTAAKSIRDSVGYALTQATVRSSV
jgi:hypothetical protein